MSESSGPQPSESATGFIGCAGYVLTDREFRIEWPGAEDVQLRNFFEPSVAALEWAMGDVGHTTSLMRLDDRIDRDRVRKVLLTEDFATHEQQVVSITCNEAFFVDILRNPNYKSRLKALHLSHPDTVFGMLKFILSPIGDLERVVAEVRKRMAPCYVIGIQMRFGTQQTSPYRILVEYNEVGNFLRTAQEIEDSLDRPQCVKWFLSTDSNLVAEQLADLYPDKLVHYPGDAVHVDVSSSPEEHLKVFADHWLLALSSDIVITVPSSFGFSARLLNLTGSTSVHPIVADAWRPAAR
eukprot:861010-Rhodomonas_salina.1